MKQCYCLLERFNNYFNRKIIKYDILSDYEDNSKSSFIPYNEDGTMTTFDFNPADNVTTEIIVNNVPFDPDYFLLLDTDGNIVQRWFILEQKRNRQGQWVYYLKRDVISDNFNSLLKAPIFVQKGMLKDNDPFIFNDEGMSFNQIKKKETLLKDYSGSAWVVCYLAKSLKASTITLNVNTEEIVPEYVTLMTIAQELGIPEAELASALNFNLGDNNKLVADKELKATYVYHQSSTVNYEYDFKVSANFDDTYDATPATPTANVNTYLFSGSSGGNLSSSRLQENIKNNAYALKSHIKTIIGRNYYLTKDIADTVLQKYSGKIILYLGNYYTLNYTSSGSIINNQVFKPSTYSEWNTVCEQTEYNDGFRTINFNDANGEITLDFDETEYRIELSAYTPAVRQYTATISSSRKVCEQQEFDIIAMPLQQVLFFAGGVDFFFQIDGLAQKIASALAIKETTNIYDVQLLPYCPVPELVYLEGCLDISNSTENVDYNYITYVDDGNTLKAGVIFYLDKASFKNKITKYMYVTEGIKVESQCNFYRLVSPNYQGSFEFNLAKNGSIEYFNIYCTYKPYTPFIKVCPNLKNLYGEDYNDNRGLICAGDFSLPRATSAWEQYQLENKNYQNIFNREIQNLNFMQSIEMRNQRISGAVGVVSDTAKGATAGAMVGGAYGAVAGGILGGATSAVGYAIDTDTLAKTQRETRQLAIDKFNYQLGNVKALPYTLTKVGAFDVSSKIFPYLEYYTCTDKEKEALRDKIKYESMTVMRIGTLEEFKDFNGQKNYFKGELIRNDEIADDAHVLNAIYEELLKGVYI